MNPFIEINKIRLNEEVNGFLIAHYKGRGKKMWEPVMENELEDILDFKLKKEVSDMSGHITII
jgi:hypothetical protein